MANQTITTIVNYDDASVSGLLNGETITINGGSVTINSDVRWNQQAAVFGNISISSTLGGILSIDGTQVWEIAFDASTGNVPTQADLGSNAVTGQTSGATGELLRVWGSGLEPLAAGVAMPTIGWIKLRTKTGTFQDDEIITLPGGATITVNSATGGRRSWIHAVGAEAGTLTLPRLGNFSVTGDWYELGTTNGQDNQQIQLPVVDSVPAIQIETAPGSGQYEWWLNAGRKFFGDVALEAATVTNVSNTADSATNSYGQNNATRMRETATAGTHNSSMTYAANTANADTYSLQIELKQETRRYAVVLLSVDNNVNRYGVIVDLQDGLIVNPITVGTPTGTSHSISSRGNGWYLVTVNVNHGNSAQAITAQWATSDSASPTLSNGLPTFTGIATEGIFFNEPRLIQTNTSHVATDARGKYFGVNYYTGVLTLARRDTANSGHKPVSGCKIRIPNVILSNANAGDWSKNWNNSTLSSRYDFTTTNAGAINLNNCICNWYPAATNPYSVTITNSAISASTVYTNVASTTTITNSAIGVSKNVIATPALSFTNCFSGVTITDCRVVRQSNVANTGASVLTINIANNVNLTNVSIETLGGAASEIRAAALNALTCTNAQNVNVINCSVIGGGSTFTTCRNIKINNFKYADLAFGPTVATGPVTALSFTTACYDVHVDGFANVDNLLNVHPYTGLINVTNNCNNIKVWNIGTPATPYNCGTVNAVGVGVALAATTTNVDLRRIYLQNTRTAPLSTVITIQNLTCSNVWGDGADSQVMGALNTIAQGCRWSNPGTVQTAVYGTHWEDAYISTTDGRLMIIANEPLASTANQCSGSFSLGSGFTSGGTVTLSKITDNVTWTMPYYAIGHNSIAKATSGANNSWQFVGTNAENHNFEYQIDKNDELGFSEWKHLVNCVRRAGGGAAGANTVTVTAADLTNLLHQPQVGDFVQTTLLKFPAGTTITNIAGQVITFSNSITTSLTTNEIIYFWKEIADEVISPSSGYKLKVRCKVGAASTTNSLSFLRIPFDTDASAQQAQYSFPFDSTGTITNIVSGSRLQIFNQTTNTELVNKIVNATSFDYQYYDSVNITEGDLVRIRLTYVNGATAKKPHEHIVLAEEGGWSVLATQEDDIVYNNIALDGSTITEFSADYPNIQVDISDPDGQTSLNRLYSWFAANEFTENGIRNFFNGIIAEDGANFKIVSGNVNLKLDNATANGVLFTGDLRLYRDDNQSPIVSTTSGGGSIIMFAGKVFVVETLQTGLTPTESAALTAIKNKTDALPASPASEPKVQEAVNAAKLAAALSS